MSVHSDSYREYRKRVSMIVPLRKKSSLRLGGLGFRRLISLYRNLSGPR